MEGTMTAAQIVFLVVVVGGVMALFMRAICESWRETGVVLLYMILFIAAVFAVTIAGMLAFEALG
jgi:hypothetical protein